MKHLLRTVRRHLVVDSTLCALALQVFPHNALVAEAPPKEQHTQSSNGDHSFSFKNVAMSEFLNFIAETLGLNFIYDENDMQFPISIHTEEPMTRGNVLSVVTQILRINGLSLIEDGNSVIITRNSAVKGIPQIISSDSEEMESPVVTRVFRLRNIDPNSIAALIQPMVSQMALVEPSSVTQQLIVTDVASNVERISELLSTVDAPNLEIDIYESKATAPSELALLGETLMKPIVRTTPFLLIPQEETNRLFIVSTPYLIETAKTTLEDLDHPELSGSDRKISLSNIVHYQAQHRPPVELLISLNEVAANLAAEKHPPHALITTIENAKRISNTHTIYFVADPEVSRKVLELLKGFDVEPKAGPTGSTRSIKVYKINNANEEQIRKSLDQMALQTDDEQLKEAIGNMRWAKETNTLLFTGTPNALKQISELVPLFDVDPNESRSPLSQTGNKSQFKVFTPHHTSAKELVERLKNIGDGLSKNNLADRSFLNTIESVSLIPGSNQLIAIGDKAGLEQLAHTVDEIDSESAANLAEVSETITLQHLSKKETESIIEKLRIENDATSIDKVTWFGNAHVRISGSQDAVDQIKEIIAQLDKDDSHKNDNIGFVRLKNSNADAIVRSLRSMYTTITQSGETETPFAKSLNTAHIAPGLSNAITFHGTTDAVKRVTEVIKEYDEAGARPSDGPIASAVLHKLSKTEIREVENVLDSLQSKSGGRLGICMHKLSEGRIVLTGKQSMIDLVKEIIGKDDPSILDDDATTFSYTPCHKSKKRADEYFDGYVQAHEKSSLNKSQALIDAIKKRHWLSGENQFVFVGSADTIKSIRNMVESFDPQASCDGGRSGDKMFTDFVTYKIQNRDLAPEDLIGELSKFTSKLRQMGISKPELFQSIHNITPNGGHEIIIPGPPEVTREVLTFISKFDSATGSSGPLDAGDDFQFTTYKLQYHPGSEMLGSLKRIASELSAAHSETNKSLINAINSLQWLESTNSLIAIEKKETVEMLGRLIRDLDVPLKQVFIEVLVIETSLSNSQSFGLEWGGKGQFRDRLAGGFGSFPPGITQSGSGSTSTAVLPSPLENINGLAPPRGIGNRSVPLADRFSLGLIGDIIMHKGRSFLTLGSLVHALQEDVDSTIVLNPKIITQDNRNSTIFVGQNIPFVGSFIETSTGGTANITSNTNIEYRDIGVNLSITPMLGDDGMITLDISNDISEQTSTSVLSGGTNNNPVNGISTSHTSMSTRVTVPDQHFLVLSGMIRDTKSHQKAGVPCLGGLPVIGAAFSRNDRTNSKSNILIFVRPHIITSMKEYQQLTSHQEEVYKEQASLPLLKEEFDAGIELVKTPENE